MIFRVHPRERMAARLACLLRFKSLRAPGTQKSPLFSGGGFSVSKKSTRCQENEYFIFLSYIIFSVTSGDGRKMIKEAATWAASSRRTCRRCGLNMKGLRPLHASPKGLIGFFDSLIPRFQGGLNGANPIAQVLLREQIAQNVPTHIQLMGGHPIAELLVMLDKNQRGRTVTEHFFHLLAGFQIQII
jgi:hypothetical protein